MNCDKTTAVSHPIQGLIKYHGLKDFEKRIPFHNSISVCIEPLATTTTVEVLDKGAADEFRIDGDRVAGRDCERVLSVLNEVRRLAGSGDAGAAGAAMVAGVKMVSQSNFPKYVGLGSSSSGFAALALSACSAFGLELPLEKVSEIARLGAGSAARAVTGGFSEMIVDGERCYSRKLEGSDEIDLACVIPLVDHAEPTEGMHREVLTSPLFRARLEYLDGVLLEMRQAVKAHDLERACMLAERDTLNLHAVTMTGEKEALTWQPATIAIIRAVWELRESGTPCWFSIDTGATPYVNTYPELIGEVVNRVQSIDGVSRVLTGYRGRETHLSGNHLF
ncbi:MAG: diphosphomevalonate decarboxylase [Thermoplasmata archaeon HGW-Thermoplasmata-1]|nr:MAG: diphosphomevalonate decarboxylase [Thermoplasmata archaeon HGW-Thermoplasmata-1]